MNGTLAQFADRTAMANSFGMHAERVEREEDLAGAVQRARANLPALLDVVVSPQARSSDGKSGTARVPDLQSREVCDKSERARQDCFDAA